MRVLENFSQRIVMLIAVSFLLLWMPAGALAEVYIYDYAVSLSWTPDPADDDIEGYEVFRSINGGTYTKAHTGLVGDPANDYHGWVDTNVSSDNSYRYYVKAKDFAGNTSDSSPSSELVYVSDGDYDDDGMDDSWELDYNLNPLFDDSAGDVDGDGFSNLEEFLDNADPRDPFSVVLTTIFVDDDNLSGHEYGTDSYPFKGIASAIARATASDTIIVRDGIYAGADNRNLSFNGKALLLRSENGPAACIIDCENAGGGFVFWQGETADAVVEGFTIMNGDAGYGGGIYCWYSSPSIRDCIIRDNSAAYGGGICLSSSSAEITNCTIVGNFADYGAAGVFAYNSDATFAHCTISDNEAISGGGIFCYYYSSITIKNSILWGNEATYGSQVLLSTRSHLTISYSTVEGGQAGAYLEHASSATVGFGNIVADPLFTGGGDYHLQAISPCIDSGIDAGTYTDIDGQLRPFGARCDMGSDEYVGP
jgi:hypothetical protein